MTDDIAGSELLAQPILNDTRENRNPLNDVEYAKHLEYVYFKLQSMESEGNTTENMHSEPSDPLSSEPFMTADRKRIWAPERLAQHEEIIAEFLSRWKNAPTNNEAVLTAGLAGGGKTTILTQNSHHELNNYAVLSADEVKEVMAKKGMFPDISGLTPMEVSALGYEESCHITNLLFLNCLAAGRNLIYDTTMGSHVSATSKLEPLREHDYKVSAVFIEVQIPTALKRSQERHRQGLDRYLTIGDGHGGRLVPRQYITGQKPTDPQYSSVNREIYNHYRDAGWFHQTIVLDNNVAGCAPTWVF